MSKTEFTERERQYLDCETPMISTGSAVTRIATGVVTSLFQAAFTPGSGKADQKLFRTVRVIRYTKYKRAVLHKHNGNITKKDAKLLAKLNKKPFVLDVDTFDADKYTQQMYDEYIRSHSEKNS